MGERGTFPSTLYLSLQMYKNLLYLYLFILPFCFFEVNIACYQQQGIVQNLNRKADFNRCFEPHSDENDVGTVNGNTTLATDAMSMAQQITYTEGTDSVINAASLVYTERRN